MAEKVRLSTGRPSPVDRTYFHGHIQRDIFPLVFYRIAVLLLILSPLCRAQAVPEHRIGVRVINGKGEFYLRDTGATFVPRGNSFIRFAQQTSYYDGGNVLDHSLFSTGLYNRR